LGLWAEEWAANEVTPSILAKGKEEEEEEVLKKEESRSIGIYIFFSLSLGCLTLVHVQSTHALALPLLHTDALHSLRFLSLSPTNLSFYIFFTFHPKCRRHYLCVVPEDDQIKIFGKGSTCPD
jgi:hypothetical protein